jgi:orotidine-5'-phosphate decarboxylase
MELTLFVVVIKYPKPKTDVLFLIGVMYLKNICQMNLMKEETIDYLKLKKEKIYTKEEVEGLLRRLAAACLTVGGDLKDADITKTAQWIKDNLK